MPYEIILFDLDGTITDSGLGIMNSVQYAVRKMGYDSLSEEKLKLFIGPPLIDSFREFCGMSDEEAQNAVTCYREYYADRGIFENKLYPGIPEMLDNLRALGCRLAIATSKPELYTKQILEHLGVIGRFDFVGGSLMNGERSRKAEVINYVLEKMGNSDLSKALMVGDRRHDIEGAHIVGVECVGVTYGYGSQEELLQAGADYLAISPERFVRMLRVLNQ